LSSVKLIGIQPSAVSHQLELLVSGADVLDGTPIYDIKPYLSFSDSHEDAKNGFAEETSNYRLDVDWEMIGLITDQSPTNHLLITYYSPTNHLLLDAKTKEAIEYILSQDRAADVRYAPCRKDGE
ncbi:MAG: SAM-dependent methyltransferase, partial [Oscillospiraceae bacterium]|nr:SAM-dependent methyltransferase [Oscillospiraceae bacterium]